MWYRQCTLYYLCSIIRVNVPLIRENPQLKRILSSLYKASSVNCYLTSMLNIDLKLNTEAVVEIDF